MSKKEKNYKELCNLYLLFSIAGILFLLIFSCFIKPKQINICNLKELEENDYVLVYGKIISERNLTKDFTILNLENSSCKIEVTCNCHGFFNKTVFVIGKISYYQNKTQINAEKVQEVK